MKKYRFLVPVVLAVLLVMSWYMLIQDAGKEDAAYNQYLADARKWAEDGVTKYAIENYTNALEMRSSTEIYEEVAEYYKSQNKMSDYLSWCEEYMEAYPEEVGAYELLLDAYVKDEDYKACYNLLEVAQKRRLSSPVIDSISQSIMYEYKLEMGAYDDVSIYSNNYCAVNSDGWWGFVDRYGNLRISTSYAQAGAFTQSAVAPVVNRDGLTYFIDKSGSKVKVSKETYASFGLLVGDFIAAKKTDGKYTYLNANFDPLFGSYDFASTINGGIGAVKTGDRWQIIDSTGKAVTNDTYVDVILDEKQIAYRNERLFVAKTEGQYIMVDGTGKQIGSQTFEDAKLFAQAAPAAVKINGKWSFIGMDGKLISDKTYDDARPFSNGLAAVCIEGKWGFVDESETVVITPDFEGSKDFNEKGSCFVQVGERWRLLKLYRLNREG